MGAHDPFPIPVDSFINDYIINYFGMDINQINSAESYISMKD